MKGLSSILFATWLMTIPLSPVRALDCSPAAWPPHGPLDAAQLIHSAQREAAAGDPAAQWLLGALYLAGQGVPQDYRASLRWLETAARTAAAAQRMASGPQAFSDIEMYDVMRNTAERALPRLIEHYGQKEGIALFYTQVRTILQGLTGCLDRGR